MTEAFAKNNAKSVIPRMKVLRTDMNFSLVVDTEPDLALVPDHEAKALQAQDPWPQPDRVVVQPVQKFPDGIH
jgi:hypothetical protein